MTELVEQIFDSFTTVITGLTGGLADAFANLIYVGGEQASGFSPLISFIFTVAGISLAAGILWKMFNMIKGSSRSAG